MASGIVNGFFILQPCPAHDLRVRLTLAFESGRPFAWLWSAISMTLTGSGIASVGTAMKIQPVMSRVGYVGVILACALAVAGCGGGGSADLILVGGGVSVPRLDIALSRPGPQAIQVDWSDDSLVDTFTVTRNGFVLADAVDAVTLIDASVVFDVEYCYQVFGYDFAGQLVSATDLACAVV